MLFEKELVSNGKVVKKRIMSKYSLTSINLFLTKRLNIIQSGMLM